MRVLTVAEVPTSAVGDPDFMLEFCKCYENHVRKTELRNSMECPAGEG
jgi:hypothetical protein